MIGKRAFVVLATLLALLQAAGGGKPAGSARGQANTPESKTGAAASPHGETHWGYEGAEGPAEWGGLNPKWAICRAGRSQSPIDIEKPVKTDFPALKAEYHGHVVDVINNGHSIQVDYTEGDALRLGDQQFRLLQYHFHSPSEHTVGGRHYPMEMHMVHKSADGKLAVVGVFIEEGQPNAAFDPIWSNLPKSKGAEYHLEHVKVDVNNLLPSKKSTYRYDGSLTTPPCSEGVKWIFS